MILAAAFPVPRAPEGRRKTSPALLAGVAFSVLVHVAGGIYLYNQRFSIPIPETPEPTGVRVEVYRPVLQPPPRQPEPVRASPPPVLQRIPDIATPSNVVPTPVPPSPTPSVPTADVPVMSAVDPVVVAPVAPLVAVAPAPADPPAPEVIGNPEWVRRPSASQLMGAYPRRALENEVAGSATLRCRVTTTGAVTGCVIASETPGGYGFGQAALRLAQYFEMRPRTVNGAPVDGAMVRIPLNFGLTD